MCFLLCCCNNTLQQNLSFSTWATSLKLMYNVVSNKEQNMTNRCCLCSFDIMGFSRVRIHSVEENDSTNTVGAFQYVLYFERVRQRRTGQKRSRERERRRRKESQRECSRCKEFRKKEETVKEDKMEES